MIDLTNWTARQRPGNGEMAGHHVALEPWDPARRGAALWDAFGALETNTLLYHYGWP